MPLSSRSGTADGRRTLERMQRRSLTFVLRSSTFLLWSVIGVLFSYGALYLVTPFGFALIAILVAAASGLRSLGGATWPETLGLFAGPGLFCLILASAADDPSSLTLIGSAWISVVLVAYLAFGRTRCSSPS